MKRARRLFICAALALSFAGGGARAESIVRVVRDAEIDWSAGVIAANAGAAADIRMPSAEAARPGSERRARAAAVAKLKGALADLPLGEGRKLTAHAIEAAVAKAKPLRLEYQSNGGVLLRLGVTFADVVGAAEPEGGEDEGGPADAGHVTPELVMAVSAAPLEVTPVLLVGNREQRLAYAVYRVGAPPTGTKAVEARRDKTGRLLLPRAALAGAGLGPGTRAIIYVDKILR